MYEGGGDYLAKCQRYYIILLNKLVNEGWGRVDENPVNLVCKWP